ncbi:MobA/MobL family protein [Bradyrhizobium sp. Ash2021]|uniref:MobA/MobL family protein n=1 Tax=Bradyrhizobium sp. Ash2021 TaxID=2954771 RepID=UPI00281560E6|nr:hypothetical protein [Bradyrhizobium sp. Ash2021]WMT76975.1 hypothetical protein NL528_11765 [Bradyrhizobium sp. Ash2021]
MDVEKRQRRIDRGLRFSKNSGTLNILNWEKDTLVAIAFARARPIPLTENDGATREFAYVGRTIMTDPRDGIPPFDYAHLRRDLAHVEVVLPAHAPQAFADPAALAFALDMAEIRKVRTPLWKRERLPQVVMSVIIALPPEFETSLHEASVIARRILVSASRSHPVPIHIAIHQAPINRHGHGDIGFRSINPDGTFGLKIPDLFARFRTHGAEANVVEGTGWPDLAWETQQSFFLERGIELVVDPFAPAPERHLDIEIPDELTTQWVNNHRLEKRYANIRLIKGSPTHLIEILLRGRSTLRVLELHRLCARFIDNDEDRLAQVDRILIDQNVITLVDTTGAQKPRYVTTRRMARLIYRAVEIIDRAGDKMIAVTGPNHDAVVAQLSDKFASEGQRRDPPLILGRSLSDCGAIADALAEHNPVVGTLDMVMGESDKRASRKKDVRMKAGRAIIVPHAELVDDQRLARLLLAVDRAGSKLFLGHDQSRETGIVCRYLAADIADRSARPAFEPAIPRHADQAREIERLLRSGLMRRAIATMADLDLLNFRSRPDIHVGDTAPLAVIDDPRGIESISDAIRMNSVRAGAIEKHETLTGPRGEVKLPLGEWVVTTGRRGLPAALDAHQLARIVAIDAKANWIDVLPSGRRNTDRFQIRSGHPPRRRYHDPGCLGRAARYGHGHRADRSSPGLVRPTTGGDPCRLYAALYRSDDRSNLGRTRHCGAPFSSFGPSIASGPPAGQRRDDSENTRRFRSFSSGCRDPAGAAATPGWLCRGGSSARDEKWPDKVGLWAPPRTCGDG